MAGTDILIHAGCSPGVVEHCLKVSELAVSFSRRISVAHDPELVRSGGLYHDIGRSKTHGIGHAVAGVQIARQLGFSGALINIIERHIGAGISAAEAERLGLPKKDYLPQTVEEKLVSYADNLISGVREMQFHEALDRFRSILGPDHEGVGLFIQQHQEIQEWISNKREEGKQ